MSKLFLLLAFGVLMNQPSLPIIKNNYVVISGCSGGGKSSLLSALAEKGYTVVEEPGRQIVKEQQTIDGDALPWVNLPKFLELALSRYIYQFTAHSHSEQTIFFDRSIIDALQLGCSQGPYFQRAAEHFRYNPRVFLVPPWEEIFANDSERKHDFAAAKKEFDELLIKYKNLGYETVIIPKMSIEERVDFILEAVKGCGSP